MKRCDAHKIRCHAASTLRRSAGRAKALKTNRCVAVQTACPLCKQLDRPLRASRSGKCVHCRLHTREPHCPVFRQFVFQFNDLGSQCIEPVRNVV